MSTSFGTKDSDLEERRHQTKNNWKWIIALSCSWVNVFIFAVFRSAGVFYGEFVRDFGCSYQQASWPVSMAGSVASTFGICAGFLTHYFHIRTLVFSGILISSTAIAVTYLATDIHQVIVTLGFIQGIGIGLVTNLLPAIISQYFDKERAIACGISYAGSTLGAFIFPLFIEWLLTIYGLSGTLLLMGGITLHGLIGAILLRPVETNANPVTNETKYGISTNDVPAAEPLIEECETVVVLRRNIDHQYVNIDKLRELRDRPKSIADFDNPLVKMRDTSHLSMERNRANRMSLPVFNERKVVRILNQSLANSPNAKVDKSVKIKYSLFDSIRRNVSQDLKIVIDVHFILVSTTYLAFILDFVAFLIVLPDFATERHLTAHQGTLLLSLFSITDLFGRLIPGWVSYLNFLSNKNIYISSISLMGICFLVFPIAYGFWSFAVLTLVCGFVTGCQMVLPAVVLSEFLGADNTAVAFGLSNFLCGSLTLVIRPLLIGLKDQTGRYDTLFYVLGLLAIGSAVLWLLESIRSYLYKTNR